MTNLIINDAKIEHEECSTASVEILNFEWQERDEWDDTRKGTMYCFKTCEANKN